MYERLKEILKIGFITCNSGGDCGYNVLIQVNSLKEAQELHREILKLTRD